MPEIEFDNLDVSPQSATFDLTITENVTVGFSQDCDIVGEDEIPKIVCDGFVFITINGHKVKIDLPDNVTDNLCECIEDVLKDMYNGE